MRCLSDDSRARGRVRYPRVPARRREHRDVRTNRLVNHLPAFGRRARRSVAAPGAPSVAARAAAVCLLAALTVLGACGYGEPETFPNVTVATIDGRRFDAAALAGRPVLITFWSTTCLVCLREMPELDALYSRFAPRGFEIIAVSMPWDPPHAVVRLARARPVPYPVALDVDGAIGRAFGDVSSTPTHVFIDAGGEVAFRRSGALDVAALEDRLRSML